MAEIGPTWAGFNDLRQDLGKVEGTAALSHAMARRFSTQSLWYDPEYGEDLRRFINAADPGPGVIERLVEAQALLDERVDDVEVEVTRSEADRTMTVDLNGTQDDDTAFALTLLVSELTVEILKDNT